MAGEDQRRRFAELETRLTQDLDLGGQARLVVNSRLIEWLTRTVRPPAADRLLGINNAMKMELRWRLPETAARPRQGDAPSFEVPKELRAVAWTMRA